jgi:hypothetical protein
MDQSDDQQAKTGTAGRLRLVADLPRGSTGNRGDALVGATEDLPAVLDLPAAAALLGVGRTTAYRLVREQRWPTLVLRLGDRIKIPTQPLLELLRGSWMPDNPAAHPGPQPHSSGVGQPAS